ncbi:hypothetical protein PVA45_05270 [Entomospira entomophila]|uniref:Lipoprotein n=1 Tax=Entomospira entomophila TaxID=2719988 RepID=A0A968GEC7_9SPIO|nr:hypothetical protein [Entomospira entomophilus]NIZ40909.1 hypothetical protein [Entomospira entomophilus]WDI35122.1 hypothetical protein PVA45_05270 [Entomospira entomophilus]
MNYCFKSVQIGLLAMCITVLAVSCAPKSKTPTPPSVMESGSMQLTPTMADEARVSPIAHPRKREYILPYSASVASSSQYEQYIHRWDDGEGVLIESGINEAVNNNGNLWIVAVQAVRSGENVSINPASTGAGTPTILFNWLNGELHPYGEREIKTGIFKNQALPLITPLLSEQYDMYPRERVLLYETDIQRNVSIQFSYMNAIKNDANMNGAGSLYRASAWRGSPHAFMAGDTVDLVFVLYRTTQDYQWYQNELANNISDPLKNTTIDHMIELQRIPVKLLN